MPFNHRAPSPNLPASSFPSSLDSSWSSCSPPRALLAAFAWDADLRRAGIEMIRRLSKPKGPRHRHTRSVDPPRLGGLERIGATQPKVALHILILAGKTVTPDEDEAEARSILLRLFREEGASVQIHTVLHTSHRLSVAVTTSTVRTSLRRAFEEGTTLNEAMKGGLDAAGFVFGEEEAEGNKGSKGFLEELAVVLKSATPDKRTTPSITLYLQQRPTEGDFDFDLSEVRAEKIARKAADVFTSSLGRSAPTASSSSSLFPPTTRNERPKSFELPRGLRLNVSSGPSDPSNRRHSFVPPSQSMLDSTSSSFRPLLLRPAPGPGAQSVSLRLAIHDAQDVVLRVTEASTPLSPTRTIPAFRRPTAVAEEPPISAPPSPTLTPSTIPIPILSRGRSRSPNSQLPRLTIPAPSAPKSPALPSSFSSDSSESNFSPDTPPVEPETASTPFNRLLFSPLEKLPPSAKPDGEGEGEGEDSPASAVDSPRWMDIRGLLKKRVEQGDQRKKREEAEASGVLFEAPKEGSAWWSR